MEQRSIALDGPSGAGKSTLAKMASKRFRMIYVDTGALYRCVALFALRNNVSTKDEQGVLGLLHSIKIDMEYDTEGSQRMLLCGEDVSGLIRESAVSMGASDVSAMPRVREFLLDMQRTMADRYDVIMDGRDIGTVILPGAGLKIFLTASPQDRAERRYLELREKGVETTLDEVFLEMKTRDKNDSERETAPLRPAEDSTILDTTGMSLEEGFAALCHLIESHSRSKG